MMADEEDPDKPKSNLFRKILTAGAVGLGSLYGGYAGGAAAGAGVNALYGARGQAKKSKEQNADTRVKPRKQQKQMLAADLKTLRSDPMALGMSEAERQARIGETTSQQAAIGQSQATSLGRSALAGQGFQAGSFADAAQGIQDQTAQATAAAARDVQGLNAQIIQGEEARIRAGLEAERAKVKETTRFWINFGTDSAAAIVAAAMGGTPSPPTPVPPPADAPPPPPQATITQTG